ncbi:MAG: AzlD domain-containing protein [Firmicutes bacterium]|nr:AzlD domain-containing protein [Bacillota bacterium]
MTSASFWWMVMGMAFVTYLPRTLPLLLGSEVRLPLWLERWLKLVPYAALGALIFPGILTVDPNRPWIGILGGIAAAAAAWKWKNFVIALAAAFLVVYILS